MAFVNVPPTFEIVCLANWLPSLLDVTIPIKSTFYKMREGEDKPLPLQDESEG
jgi:hypothetical protein